MRRGVMLFLSALLAAAAMGAVAWAVVTTMRPAEDPSEATTFTHVKVAAGEVGSSLQLNTVAEWAPVPTGTNRAVGVITTVRSAAGDEVDQGSVLYSVNLRPVTIAQGSVPMFRDVGAGMKGADVKQVQQLLRDLGYYQGAIEGVSGAGTAAAINAWQESLGVEPSGMVRAGDLVFVPSLPTRIILDSDVVSVGASLAGGESVLAELPDSPTFSVPVTDAQAAMMPKGTRVEIAASGGGTWKALVDERIRDDETGVISMRLAGEGDAVICGAQCDQVPVTGEVALPSEVVVTERVSGLTVPSSALVSGSDGQIGVIDGNGKRHPVTVVASARGMSVIEGVSEGTRVRVPGEARQ